LDAQHNPYAEALDGLVLEDPVAAFFAFCREREGIRQRRDHGAPPPWSDDPIFCRGRFLNVFREDDRASRSILRFTSPLADDLEALIPALFFARWCNKAATLDALSPALLSDPPALRRALEALDEPWCNLTAYPVEPLRWRGRLWPRLDAATELFVEIKEALAERILGAGGRVTEATERVNALFGMANDFPIFMAVMDIAWFRPDVIDPASPVPTGIGAAPYLDRLQRHLGLDDHHQTCEAMMALQARHWPEAKRRFQPIDIEYLACECRKYYSYVHGTKSFSGKNRFRAGASARLEFDVAASPAGETVETRIHVIAGGPCAGKTTVLEALEKEGHPVVPETARTMLEAGIARGLSAAELRADPIAWQQEVFRADHRVFDSLAVDTGVFTDTSFIEDTVFGARGGLFVGPNLEAWLRHKRYRRVFFLAPLDSYEQGGGRLESERQAREISEQVFAAYRRWGYEPIVVPALPVAERVAWILAESALD
jgi:predicted ATPase